MTPEQFRNYAHDADQAAVIGHDAVLRATNTIVAERTSIIRDTLNLAVPTLAGAVTLYILAAHLVKTPLLFFLSIGCLILSIAGGLILRMRILTYIQEVVRQLETQLIQNTGAARVLRTNPIQNNFDTLVRQETTQLILYNDKWVTGKSGYASVIILMLVGLLGIGLALLFRITV